MVISKIAYRYAFSKGNRHRSASLVIMVGLAIGMAALITLLALMNNLQHDLLEQVKSIESFHLQLSVASEEGELEAIKGAIKATAGVESTFAFVNTQVMVANPSNQNSSTGRLRVVDPAIWESANPFSDHLFLIAGNYPEGAEEIALSNAMAQSLKCRVGEELNVTLLVPGRTAPLAPATLKFRVSAIYSTSLREFDESTLLTSSEQLLKRLGLKRTTFGIFLKEGSVDKSHNVITELTKRVPEATIMSWQQLNSAFYSALTLEKIMMYLFLSFMFFILGVNMKSASSRLLFIKQRELAILRAIGAPRETSLKIFLMQSLLITLLGLLLGILFGWLITSNIGGLFAFFDSLQYLFTHHHSPLLSYPFVVQLKGTEIAIVAIVVLILTQLFTYFGIRVALKREPLELLYHA